MLIFTQFVKIKDRLNVISYDNFVNLENQLKSKLWQSQENL